MINNNDSISCSSSSTSDSSSNFLPIGFNVDRVRKLHQDATENISVMSKLDNLSINNEKIPIELQYETLLENAMVTLHKSTIELNNKRKIPLEVKREPGLKTSINLLILAKSINRNEEHLKSFILNELHTTGSINKEGRLLIRGSFLKNRIQSIISSFLDQYVKCNSCGKYDTEIIRETRLWFIMCKKCSSKRSVEIEGGFYNKK